MPSQGSFRVPEQRCAIESNEEVVAFVGIQCRVDGSGTLKSCVAMLGSYFIRHSVEDFTGTFKAPLYLLAPADSLLLPALL